MYSVLPQNISGKSATQENNFLSGIKTLSEAAAVKAGRYLQGFAYKQAGISGKSSEPLIRLIKGFAGFLSGSSRTFEFSDG